jgi:Flp pilus assembly protein TadG
MRICPLISPASERAGKKRRGAVLPLVTLCLVGLMGLIALAIDVGMMVIARTQAQDAADAAALAGARMLDGGDVNNNLANAISRATTAATDNQIFGTNITNAQVTLVQGGVYRYSTTSQRFQAVFNTTPTSTEAYGVMQVSITSSQPTFFGKLFGLNSYSVSGTATAVHRPRDIAIVLDFSTSMQYSSNTNMRGAVNNGPTAGSINPDTLYPQFGPWSIFPSSEAPNVMIATAGYGDRGGEGHGLSNITTASTSGPSMVNDFLYTSDGGTTYVNAFVVGDPSSYSASLTPVVTPAPSTWVQQYGTSGVLSGYDGDAFPLKQGKTTPSSPADYAHTVQEFLTGSNTGFSNSSNGNSTFQNNGYDYNPTSGTTTAGKFKGYSMGPAYYGKSFYMWPPDPRYTSGANPASPATPAAGVPPKDTSGNLICDWRQRFFTVVSTGKGVTDNSLLWDAATGTPFGTWIAPNNVANGTIAVNYPAVLAWLKQGPQTLPSNLQCGRVIYYSSIPSNVTTSGTTAADLDKVFWKKYIDFVLGIPGNHGTMPQNDDIAHTLYGYGQSTTNSVTYGSGMSATTLTYGPTPTITKQSSLTGNSPAPYMSYTDAPIHPLAHFWFGPFSMISFLTGPCEYSRNWNPGAGHEAQSWHLKAGIQSAVTDIQNNHPNDNATLIFFSTLSQYNTARVPMGKSYTYMTNVLWYPYSLISTSDGSVSGTMRPYDINFNDLSQGVIPNANGGTNPTGGFMTAYNQFSANSSQGFVGRVGATKLVIFETDGVAHDYYANPTLSGSGAYQCYYTYPGNTDEAVSSNINMSSKTVPITVVQQLCASTTANPPGYSTTRNPTRVHAIGFGEIFEPYLTSDTNAGPMQSCALQFLLNVQQAGGTSPSTDTIQTCWGYPGTPTGTGGTGGYTTGTQSFKIIVGDYSTRISLIQQALQRIMQSGVQVALIQ